MAKISSRPGPHEVMFGVDWNGPPTLSQLNHWPLYQRCHRPLSVPRATTSIRLGPHETADGCEASTPPNDSQSCQAEPSNQRCQRAPSTPVMKMSRRFGPQEATVGAEVRIPPRPSHGYQAPALYQRCQSALSAPRTKTSIRSVPQETATGSEASTPPSDSQLHQALWLYHLWISELLGPRAKMSSRPGPQEEAPGPEVMVPPSDSLRIHASPAPLSGTVCGLPLPLLLMVRVPVLGPIADGRKVTLMVQLASGARLLPQVLAWVKSPVVVTPLIASAMPLRSVTWIATVVALFSAWVSKFTLVWVSDATGRAVAEGVTAFDAPETLAPTEWLPGPGRDKACRLPGPPRGRWELAPP